MEKNVFKFPPSSLYKMFSAEVPGGGMQICIKAWPAEDPESLTATPLGDCKAKAVCDSGGP